MSALKDGRLPIELDKQRHLLFSLNVLDAVQDKFGAIENLASEMTGSNAIKNIRWIFTLLINEGATDDEILTESQVGKLIHTGNFKDVQNAIFEAFSLSSGGADDEEIGRAHV